MDILSIFRRGIEKTNQRADMADSIGRELSESFFVSIDETAGVAHLYFRDGNRGITETNTSADVTPQDIIRTGQTWPMKRELIKWAQKLNAMGLNGVEPHVNTSVQRIRNGKPVQTEMGSLVVPINGKENAYNRSAMNVILKYDPVMSIRIDKTR